jgi:hypothetical protein
MGSPIVDRPKMLGHLYFNNIPLEIYGNQWRWYPRQETQRPIVKQNGISLPFLKINEKSAHDTRYYFLPRIKAEGYSFLYGLGLKLQQQWFPKPINVEEFYAHIPTWVINGEYKEEDFVKLVRSAAINIGFTHMHKRRGPHATLKQIRMRDIEIPMTGSFLLTEECNETAEYFVAGKHLDTFTNENDMLEKVRYYLSHPDERNEIAAAGRNYALANHTWAHRFKLLLGHLGISVNNS